MECLKVGHCTNLDKGTGLSVLLFDRPVVGAYTLCGASPASYDLPVLNLEAHVTTVNALMLTGGSTFGLPAVQGVLRWLKEQKQGWETPYGLVPIVPAAAIYDLGVKSGLPPTEVDAYAACVAAKQQNMAYGRMGAGTGATVGKLMPAARPMSGGLGCAELTTADGVQVIAYAVVNSVGDVRDEHGQIIAGAHLANGQFGDCQAHLLSGLSDELQGVLNTTLVAVVTNAHFSKIELKRIANMATAGMARSITPVFTRYDGDLVFCFSAGERQASEMMVGAMAVEAVQQAIRLAVSDSEKL